MKHIYVVTLDRMHLAAFDTLKDAYSFVLRQVKFEKQNGRFYPKSHFRLIR